MMDDVQIFKKKIILLNNFFIKSVNCILYTFINRSVSEKRESLFHFEEKVRRKGENNPLSRTRDFIVDSSTCAIYIYFFGSAYAASDEYNPSSLAR